MQKIKLFSLTLLLLACSALPAYAQSDSDSSGGTTIMFIVGFGLFMLFVVRLSFSNGAKEEQDNFKEILQKANNGKEIIFQMNQENAQDAILNDIEQLKNNQQKVDYPPISFVAIDFETANKEYTSICYIGLAVYEQGKLVDTKSWFVRPYPFRFLVSFTDIHGIGKVDVEDCPKFKGIWEELKLYIKDRLIVAHNADFDIGCLEAILSYSKIEKPAYEVACTLKMSRKFLNLTNYKLPTVAKYFEIPLKHHDALSDAVACGEILLRIAKQESLQTNEKVLASKWYKNK